MDKLITMVKYQDLSVFTYNKDSNDVEELPLINRPIFMEYMIGEFKLEEFIGKNYSKIRGNCIGDMVLLDVYAVKMGEDIYKNLFKGREMSESEKLKNIFVNLFFLEDGPVVHQGFFNYVLNTHININNI